MRRKFAHGTKVRLSFSDRPHAPVNIADSMENAGSCSWIQRGDGSQVMKNFKDLRKLGVQSIEEYREASMPFPAFFHWHFFHTIRHVYRSMWPAREAWLHFDAMFIHSVHDCETHLLWKAKKTQFTFHGSFYHSVLCISVTWAPMQTYASCYTISIPLYFLFNYF